MKLQGQVVKAIAMVHFAEGEAICIEELYEVLFLVHKNGWQRRSSPFHPVSFFFSIADRCV